MELEEIDKKIDDLRVDKYQNLSSWEKVLLVRHPQRPTTREYIELLFDEWIELHGDRYFRDDRAVIAGLASFQGIPVTVIGHQKGKDTAGKVRHNFGMPHPEGYRKVLRLLLQAEKFKRPVLTFVDTSGAYPGVGAEERGQAWAIAQVLQTLSALKVPVISIITGEGGSGGALALAVADRIIMFSHGVFSVASCEACASILWRDIEKAEEMARALKITAQDLLEFGIINEIIAEPAGGAQEDINLMAEQLKTCIPKYLNELMSMDWDEMVKQRYQKLRDIGVMAVER
jgi:acetyl-CoA carboxylase carboxyl transferase subunit alpha